MENPIDENSPTIQEQISEEVQSVFKDCPELAPLRPIIEGVAVGRDGEERFAFASLLQSLRDSQGSKFDERFEREVPNNLRPTLEQYGRMPKTPKVAQPGAGDDSKFETGIFTDFLDTVGLRWPDDAKVPTFEDELPLSSIFTKIAHELLSKAIDFPHNVFERGGQKMKYVPSLPFENWGLTVNNTPASTFIARTEEGLRSLVKWAGEQKPNKKVRVAGYRHTWTDFFSNDNEVLVMLLPLEYLVSLSATSPSLQAIQALGSDLVGISDPIPVDGSKSKHALCTVKAGTTNEMFRTWCLQKRRWCLPFNVIMVEITFGGSNGPICHGSGLKSTTLSDIVEEFYYIDPNGESKCIKDRNQLRAASGCFGLLGICTAVTLRLDAMTMAVMNPVRQPLSLAIPPPPGFDVPLDIRRQMETFTPQQLKDAEDEFIKRFGQMRQFNGPKTQTSGISHFTLMRMPDRPKPQDAVKTLFSEALHFRRGIQNMRCRNSEWEIPIPAVQGDPKTRDYTTIQRAWWDGIKAFYDHIENAPVRVALEMRLTGDSDVMLAPQRHNKLGTISIEAVTTMATPSSDWELFLQDVVERWAQYKDSEGKLLNIRPHWAKQWQGLTIRGQPAEAYLKETAYKDAIPEFVKMLGEIAATQGTTVSAMRNIFGNNLLERLFFES
ncbi:hypothetical protein BN14_09695 [Rhizoctonia solani AG-1 IB]|uniref:FAD-binding PCMH-type domain-containing protein n=1 Tax=Thanatephorus cucumeris (strain AG1-IB / isolate 7/3/14) TaxID=1108050 RepID=M5CG65_THACB|nr:hypothetical protein BN14_09695 [Rhizoctonia solani AG-1 IB]